MIDTTMRIACDGEIDGDLCEAEFTVENYGGANVDPLHVAHQLQQRGWTVKRPATRVGHLALCPLHADVPTAEQQAVIDAAVIAYTQEDGRYSADLASAVREYRAALMREGDDSRE